ncbi:hypothetical protein IGB42_02911 [Andreprevotia sp. IGB-42]|nr:hypothetical protein IGB42_02911 [Andreprevotia sp. IGB-42]
MYFLLRCIRGLAGLIFVGSASAAFKYLGSANLPGTDTGHAMAIVLFMAVLMSISGGVFFGLRKLINTLHQKNVGTPHPKLAASHWAL